MFERHDHPPFTAFWHLAPLRPSPLPTMFSFAPKAAPRAAPPQSHCLAPDSNHHNVQATRWLANLSLSFYAYCTPIRLLKHAQPATLLHQLSLHQAILTAHFQYSREENTCHYQSVSDHSTPLMPVWVLENFTLRKQPLQLPPTQLVGLSRCSSCACWLEDVLSTSAHSRILTHRFLMPSYFTIPCNVALQGQCWLGLCSAHSRASQCQWILTPSLSSRRSKLQVGFVLLPSPPAQLPQPISASSQQLPTSTRRMQHPHCAVPSAMIPKPGSLLPASPQSALSPSPHSFSLYLFLRGTCAGRNAQKPTPREKALTKTSLGDKVSTPLPFFSPLCISPHSRTAHLLLFKWKPSGSAAKTHTKEPSP